MVTLEYRKGVFVPEAGLWLDPQGRKPFAFVSHAHSDHTGRHERIFCSHATARLTAARLKLKPDRFQTARFGERVTFPRWTGTLLPAGHVLGSAQLFFENEDGTFLYTGDFKRRRGLSSEATEACHADTLIIETTYGLPKYRFPPAEESILRLQSFCAEALADGQTPVLLGYSLGKAQEILKAVEGCGFPIMLHPAIAGMVAIYQECGMPMPACAPWNPGDSRGHAVICPPNATSAIREIPTRRMASVTGWAMDSWALRRMGVDAAIPLSDHADYGELLDHVQAVSPNKVLTLHGFAQEFARDLRRLGIEAWALTGPNQMEWDL